MAKARRKSTTHRPHRGTERSATGTIGITGKFIANAHQLRPYTYTIWKPIGEGPGRTGRPSAKDVIREEAAKRIAADVEGGERKPLKFYATTLKQWFGETHLGLRAPAVSTIEKHISHIWNNSKVG